MTLFEELASAIAELYDPYELRDQDATSEELYEETIHLLETEPETVAEWLEGR